MRFTSTLVTTLCGALLLPMVAGAQTANADLAGRVGKLEQALSNRGLIDLLNQVENLKQENQALRGQIENQGYEIEQLKKGQAAVYGDMDRRLQTLEGGAPAQPAGEAPLPMLAPAPGDAVAGTPAPQSALQVETEGLPPVAPPPGQDPLDAADGSLPPGVDDAAALDADAVGGAGAPAPPPIQPTLAPAPMPGRPAAGVTSPGEAAPALGQGPTLDDAASRRRTAMRSACCAAVSTSVPSPRSPTSRRTFRRASTVTTLSTGWPKRTMRSATRGGRHRVPEDAHPLSGEPQAVTRHAENRLQP